MSNAIHGISPENVLSRLLADGTCTIHVSAVLLLLPQNQRNIISGFREPSDPVFGAFLYTIVAESGTGIYNNLQQLSSRSRDA